MSLMLQCSCGARLRVNDESIGHQVRCPVCERVLDAPTAEECTRSGGATPLRSESSSIPTCNADPEREAPAFATDAAGAGAASDESSQPTDPAPGKARPAYRLASPGQIGWAAFLGGPLSGLLLMGRNYTKIGKGIAGWVTITTGALLTAAVVAIGVTVSETNNRGNWVSAILLWLGTYYAARQFQGRMFEDHRGRGGRPASGWTVAGFILLGITLTLGFALGVAAIYEFGFGDQRLQVSSLEEVYYDRGITEFEARTLAGVLQEQQFFDGASEKSVMLRKSGEEYVVSFVLLSGFDDPDVNQYYREMAGEVSHAFGGRPVRVELCDTWSFPKKKLPAVRKR
jgi:hypothetical protein